MTADAVIVSMCGDSDDRPVDQISELASHAVRSHHGVHNQVAVSAL